MNPWEALWATNRDYGALPSFGSDDFENLHRQDSHPEPLYDFDFGENFLGIKSVTDLKDFITAHDVVFQAIHDAVSKTPTSSPPWPPGGYAAWYADYMRLINAWQPARAAALNVIANSQAATAGTGTFNAFNPLQGMLGSNTQSGQPYYDNLLRIVQPAPMSVTPGDLQDLHNRLDAVQKIPAYNVPQPTKDSDEQVAARNALAPFDPIGDAKAAENWKKDAIIAGSLLVGALFLATVVAKKV